jgi:hypothetical protein
MRVLSVAVVLLVLLTVGVVYKSSAQVGDGCFSVAISPNDVPYFVCVEQGRNWIMKFERGKAEDFGDVEPISNLKFGPDGTMYGIAKTQDKVLRIVPGGKFEVLCEKTDARLTEDPSIRLRMRFEGLCVDPSGLIYVSDTGNGWIISISQNGDVRRVAGADPIFEGAGEGAKLIEESKGLADGSGTNAKFFNPANICAGPKGEVYISEGSNGVIRKLENGTVTTIAGSFDASGQSRAGFRDGPGNGALFSFWVTGIACDKQGNVFVVDGGNKCVRQLTWNPQANIYYVYTLAGSPKSGKIDKDGTGLAASFDENWKDIVVDSSQNLYVTKHSEFIIRQITFLGVVKSFDIR